MDINLFEQQLLTQASAAGFTEAEIYYEYSTAFSCKVYEGEIDSYETSDEGGVGFRGLYHGKMGYAYTEKIDETSIAYLIDHAKANAAILDEDDGTTIFEGSIEYHAFDYYAKGLKEVTTEEKIQLLKTLEEKVLAYDEAISAVNYCMYHDFSTEKRLANDKGLSLQEKQNGLYVLVVAVAKNGEEIKTGGEVKFTRDFHSLDVDEIAKEAAEEALSQLGEISIPSKRYPVILRNNASASMLAVFTPAFSAENTQKHQSLLEGKVGEKVASTAYSVVDAPYHPKSLWGTSFDGEGVATKKQTIIGDGLLHTLFHNRKTAAKDGVETTGHAQKSSYKGTLSVSPINLYIEPGMKTHDELVSDIQEGIYITDLAGLHSGVSAISGDFSLAASGFYIKNGKIDRPVKQMTIAGNYFDYLKQVNAVATDLAFFQGGYGSPSISITELAITVDE